MIIRLKPITVENWKAVTALELAPDQHDFVPSNLYSIAEAQFYPEARSRAVYNEADVLVGYALYGRDVFTGKWKVFRMMIDVAHQGKGYGKATMREIIKVISAKPDGAEILLCYNGGNTVAKQLYIGLGFEPISTDDKGIVTAQITTTTDSR